MDKFEILHEYLKLTVQHQLGHIIIKRTKTSMEIFASLDGENIESAFYATEIVKVINPEYSCYFEYDEQVKAIKLKFT